EIDARMPVRAEAALATLAEVSSSALGRPTGRGVGRAGTGFVTGELLSQVGDADAAIASFERAGDAEPAPSLAARPFELAGRASRDPEDAARWLDRALALAPRSVPARWRRVDARLTLGRLEDALADVEHLEALARGVAPGSSARDRPLARRCGVVGPPRACDGPRRATRRPAHGDRTRFRHPRDRPGGRDGAGPRGAVAGPPGRSRRRDPRLRPAPRRRRIADPRRSGRRPGSARHRSPAPRGGDDGARRARRFAGRAAAPGRRTAPPPPRCRGAPRVS